MILTLAIASIEYLLPFHLPAQFGETTFIATAFYMAGYLCRKSGMINKICYSWAILLFAVPAVAAIFFSMSMNVKGWIILPYCVIATCGTIGVFFVSKSLASSGVSSILAYIGNKTLYILVFHFLAFKLVGWIYICCTNLPNSALTQFPTIANVPSWLWIVYSVVGMVLPLLIWELNGKLALSFRKIKSKI